MLFFLRLVRLPNLIIIALTQFLVRYCIIIPAYQTQFNAVGDFPAHQTKWEFLLLVCSTLLIAAGGYIINDVFDVRIDEVNKPGKNIIDKRISEKTARLLFFIFSGIGIAVGFYLAVKIKKPVMGFVNIFSVGSLWMYSSYYKKRLLIGNFIIAMLSALSLMIVPLYEVSFYPNIQFAAIYGLFAFLASFIREIIKDAEDMDGDEQAQCKTLPILFGIKITKAVAAILILITIGVITYFLKFYFYNNTVINFWNLVAMFAVPFLGLLYLVITAREKKDFHYASIFTKGIMVYGILSMIPFYYYFLK